MKYQNLLAFEKHLEQAAKVQLSRIFLLVVPCPSERKKIAEKIASAIRSKEGDIRFHMEDGAQSPLEDLIEGLNTTSLFTGSQVLYIDGIDKLKKNGLAPLAEYAANPSPFSYLLLGAASAKSLTDLATKGKKELIVCDLSDEKPWDRKDRLKRMIIDCAATAGKRINSDATEYLLENVGLNLPGLEQEIEKLISYAAGRSVLTLQDVHTLCAAQKSSTLWQISDAIAWKESFPKLEENIDLSLLLPLISQLRTQFQHGLSLSILMERGVPHVEIAQHVPHIKPVALDKILPYVKSRKSSYFKRALNLLFEMELMTKNSAFDASLILDLFVSKLTLLKRF